MFDAVVRGAFRTILRRVFAAQWRASRRLQVVLISAVGVSLFFALTAGAPLGGAAPTKTFSIGGTVSGLSGTVVLQDNGGDDLSVSSSGPFTFATKLPTGAAYNVTVKTNPSGQTCSITNGTGTVGTANVTSITLTCTTWTSASENFNRANGGLGASWAATSDGSLSIVSQQALGKAGAYAGNIRVAESYGSDQYSQIEVTSTQLSGNQWIGPTVRSQNGGQNTYLGIYVWNNGNAQLRLYKRTAGTLTQLGSSYKSGPLPAGTKLTLTAIGSTISFQQNGATRIAVTDNTLTGGAAGLMTFGAARADNWAGGTGTVPPPPPSTYSIGGTVSGLSGTVVLQDNGGDDLTVSANGAFAFATKLATGTPYNVTVKTSPSGQTCSVTNSTGTVGTANVTSITVTCTTSTYSIGGTVSGLSGTVVLQDNGGDDLTVSANGAFAFATKLATGTPYNVTVKTNPSGQTCSVTNSTGTVGTANVTSITVTCTTSTYSIGGTVSGLSGTVVLQDNGGDDLTVSANGAFAFATKLATGTPYNVTVKTNPSGQTCSVTNGSGIVGTANVTSITVTCTASTYSIGGTVSGLSGTVVLQDNGGDDLTVSANGAFAFATKLATGTPYNVTVKTSPSGQTCSVTNSSGTVGTANVTSVAVSCTTLASASDDFNRADGGLGAGWVAMTSDGGLSIASQQVVGTATGHAGDIRTAESYGSDQYSQIEVTSTQLTGGQWIGPTVRSQNGGQDTYLGIYFWNNGTPQLQLYKRTAGTFTQLGSSYDSGPLPAGTKLTLTAIGSTISFQQDGATRIAVTDNTLTGGAAGLMTFGAARADNWAGGTGTVPPPPSTYSIGGTVSGLSGTVVLQDNGGDDLTVSANGAFAFATKLATGAAVQRHGQDQPERPDLQRHQQQPAPSARRTSPASRSAAPPWPPPVRMISTGRMVVWVRAGWR